MSGTELKEGCLKLGITIAELSRASGLSDTTLSKVFGDLHVRATTRAKALNAFRRLESQLGRSSELKKLAPKV